MIIKVPGLFYLSVRRVGEGDAEKHEPNENNVCSLILGPGLMLDGSTVASRFLHVELELNVHLRRLSFSEPVHYIYNPLEYAWEPHRCFVETYCRGGQSILFLGMNPGPFGMAQTGVRMCRQAKERAQQLSLDSYIVKLAYFHSGQKVNSSLLELLVDRGQYKRLLPLSHIHHCRMEMSGIRHTHK